VPAGPNELDDRISRIWKAIPFEDARQQYRFSRYVQAANRFEELPEWCQQLIREAEAGKEETADGSYP
jgi:hypothetical protein